MNLGSAKTDLFYEVRQGAVHSQKSGVSESGEESGVASKHFRYLLFPAKLVLFVACLLLEDEDGDLLKPNSPCDVTGFNLRQTTES